MNHAPSPDPRPRGAAPPGAALRIGTIPHADAYVDAVLPGDVVRIGAPGEPSPWLDPAYLAEHARDIDVLHLHAGHGHLSAQAVECWAETVRRLGIPLVVTVHQLRNPDQSARLRHDAHLGTVLGTAEVVLTLTPGAADEIAVRFGRTAIVVAHPSVAAPDPAVGADRGVVGIPVGRPSPAVPDPEVLVRAALSGAVSGGGRLRVLLDRDVDPGTELPGIAALAEEAALELVRRAERGGAGWAAQLQQLHAAVLPDRCGTHSRDVEICRDVGTRVVAPSCGMFAQQWSEVVPYLNDERRGLDPVSLTVAVGAALARPMVPAADRTWRARQRLAVQRVHADVYAQVAGDRSWV